eukprot:6214637-Pleurochrysis_carterae.AAC.5
MLSRHNITVGNTDQGTTADMVARAQLTICVGCFVCLPIHSNSGQVFGVARDSAESLKLARSRVSSRRICQRRRGRSRSTRGTCFY